MVRRLWKLLPEPWRGRVGLRRTRRWLAAGRFVAGHNRAQPPNAPAFSFYPMRPGPNSEMAAIMRRLGVRISLEPSAGALRFAWDTGTWFSPRAAARLAPDAINRACLDISKTTVDRTWAATAGYSISVDPTTTEGPIAVKPEINGLHAGRLIVGPIARRQPGMVYQRLVDTRHGDELVQGRPVIIGGRIVITFAKWRPYPSYFDNNRLSLPRPTDEIYSAHEQRLLLEFAAALGLEYGELDVLRDVGSGRLYVVDANRTPVRPRGLPIECDDVSYAPMVEAFRELMRVA